MTNSFFVKMNKKDTLDNREKISDEIINLFTSANISFLENGNLVINTSDDVLTIKSKILSLDVQIKPKRATNKFSHKENNINKIINTLDVLELS